MSATKIYHRETYPSLDPTRLASTQKGKTIVITGGGTGIGAETAKYFAKAGASRIAILGRREQPLLDIKAQIEAIYSDTEVLAIPGDITKKSEVDAAFAKIAGKGKIDVLVSNAAVMGTQGPIVGMLVDDFLAGIVTNLRGCFNLTKTFLKYATKDAVLIETNSAAAHLTMGPGFASYNVSKAATARFYDSLAFEHPGLSTFCVHPGGVATDISREAGYEPSKDEDFKSEGDAESNLSKFNHVNLPASFFVWLATPEARFLKGKYLWANWDVDELKARAQEIQGSSLLNLGLIGWPFSETGEV